MGSRTFVRGAAAFALAAAIFVSPFAPTVEAAQTYRVTIQNLAATQPMSPPVVATHRAMLGIFDLGGLASPQLEAVAETGDQVPLFNALDGALGVTDVVDLGMPLTPAGTTVGGFSDAATFTITADPWDRLSLATMLICTNDGFTGIDRRRLPAFGSTVALTASYDAGTEDNTEASMDIPDPCSALGPVVLNGDPNGNIDDDVDTMPHRPIHLHRGVLGIADLLDAHNWTDPVAKVTVTRINDDARRFNAPLSGVAEVPPLRDTGRGRVALRLSSVDDRIVASYVLHVVRVAGPVAAHVHLGDPNENGPVVAALFAAGAAGGVTSGVLAAGTITEGDLVGPLAGDMDGFLAALRDGRLYVNVHTEENPGGAIRGQLGAMDGLRPRLIRPDFGHLRPDLR